MLTQREFTRFRRKMTPEEEAKERDIQSKWTEKLLLMAWDDIDELKAFIQENLPHLPGAEQRKARALLDKD